MNRGDVYWVNFDPSVGGEIQKTRPAILVSNDSANKYLNRVQVIPVTSNIKKVYPSDALVNIKDRKGKAMTDQLTTISKERLLSRIGKVTPEELNSIDHAIKVQLDLI